MRSTFKQRLENIKFKGLIPEKFIDLISLDIMEAPILLNKHHVMCRTTYIKCLSTNIEHWKESSESGKKAHDFQQIPVLVTILGGQEPLTTLENLDYLKTQIETWVKLQELKDKITKLPISYKFPFFAPVRQERLERLNQLWASLNTRLFALLKTEKDNAQDNPAEFNLLNDEINTLSFTISFEEKIEAREEKIGEFELAKEEKLKEIKSQLFSYETRIYATFDPENTMKAYEAEHEVNTALARIDVLNKEREALTTLTFEQHVSQSNHALRRIRRPGLFSAIQPFRMEQDEVIVLSTPAPGKTSEFL